MKWVEGLGYDECLLEVGIQIPECYSLSLFPAVIPFNCDVVLRFTSVLGGSREFYSFRYPLESPLLKADVFFSFLVCKYREPVHMSAYPSVRRIPSCA